MPEVYLAPGEQPRMILQTRLCGVGFCEDDDPMDRGWVESGFVSLYSVRVFAALQGFVLKQTKPTNKDLLVLEVPRKTKGVSSWREGIYCFKPAENKSA